LLGLEADLASFKLGFLGEKPAKKRQLISFRKMEIFSYNGEGGDNSFRSLLTPLSA
jgi:hypothetical protein